MKHKICSLAIALTALATATGTANAYCYNGSGKVAYFQGSYHSKINATHLAKRNWENKARKALHTTAVYWGNASHKSITAGVSRGRYVMVARAKFCVSARKKPHRTGKCPKRDVRCKVNSMVYKTRPSVIPRGVRVGLNPQPEPPSRGFKRY